MDSASRAPRAPAGRVLSALADLVAIVERKVTPARGLAVVALAATIGLGASQFSDYRAVEIGATSYRAVENVAPAPEVDRAVAARPPTASRSSRSRSPRCS